MPFFLDSGASGRHLLGAALILLTTACKDRMVASASRPAEVQTVATKKAAIDSAPLSRFVLSAVQTTSVGTYIADGSGRAVYVLDDDSSNGAACTHLCLAIWPPVAVGNAIPQSSDSAILQSSIGVVTRDGGTVQITFRGRPLYYYLGDQKPGDTRGHHVEDSWGEWKLISPAGRPLSSGDGGRRSRSE